ncbi:MAG TPA: hypothetical protein VJ023_17370 [Pyrinomonadaceae bacterium]|nr:hypothetical protein [Pyrinomonadaceae bacterium]
MHKTVSLLTFICLLLVTVEAFSQSQDLPKFEIGAEFTTLNREGFTERRTDVGLGARFTYNVNKNLSVEGAGYFFPHRCFTCVNNGRVTQGVAGIKIGKRFERWGIFAKARPGVVSFSEGQFNITPSGTGGVFPFAFEVKRLTNFAMDLGGVIEFYPSKRIVTRIDAGNTLVHFTRRTNNDLRFDPTIGDVVLVPITRPAKTTHNFQFITSVGFRF